MSQNDLSVKVRLSVLEVLMGWMLGWLMNISEDEALQNDILLSGDLKTSVHIMTPVSSTAPDAITENQRRLACMFWTWLLDVTEGRSPEVHEAIYEAVDTGIAKLTVQYLASTCENVGPAIYPKTIESLEARVLAAYTMTS